MDSKTQVLEWIPAFAGMMIKGKLRVFAVKIE